MKSIIVWENGWGAEVVLDGQDKIRSVRLFRKPPKDVQPDNGSKLSRQLRAYFRGEPVELEGEMDWSVVTEFQRKVYRELMKVKRGQTVTYGELAERVGGRKYTRAVAGAMARNPFPLIVPCHRVVGVNGLTGFSAEGGIETKARLLELEKKS